MKASRERGACVTAADCAVVTGPGHHLPDYHQVVHATDAAALDARAREHLRTCGAFHHHAEIGVFTTVEARCVAARCGRSETSYHPEAGSSATPDRGDAGERRRADPVRRSRHLAEDRRPPGSRN